MVLAEPGESDGQPFTLPSGYEIKVSPPSIVGPDGDVIATEGDVIEGNGDTETADSTGTSCDRGVVTVVHAESFLNCASH